MIFPHKKFATRDAGHVQDAQRRYSLAAEEREEAGRLIVTDTAPEKRYMTRRVDVTDQDTIALSFSSETPVMRWGEPEVLCHTKNCVDLSRLEEVGACLFNHNPDSIIGTPSNIRVDADRVCRCDMTWGSTANAKERRQEVADKSLRGVSVGYIVLQWMYFQEEGSFEGRTYPAGTWLATKWQALEVSLTPIAADPTVGLGRADVNNVRITRTQSGGSRMNKRVKLLRAWNAMNSEHKAGDIVEVDERQADELIEKGIAEEVREECEPPAKREAQVAPPVQAPEKREEPIDAEAVAKRAIQVERTRCKEIRAIGKQHSIDVTRFIDDDSSVEAVREAVLTELVGRDAGQASHGTINVMRDGAESFRDAAVSCLIMRAGMSQHVSENDKRDFGGSELRGFSLKRLAEESLRRKGVAVPGSDLELVRLATRSGFPTSSYQLRHGYELNTSVDDLPYILAATANKMLLAGSLGAPQTWRLWAAELSANDFKNIPMISMSTETELPVVAEGDDYTASKRSDKQETMAILARGRVFSVTRQVIINDDLNALTRIPFQQGYAAAATPGILAVRVLLANGNMSDGEALFSTAHNNISTETDYALGTVATARAGISHMIQMVDVQTAYTHADMADEVDIGVSSGLKTVLVPPTGYVNAKAALNSTSYGDGVEGTNPLKDEGIQVVKERLLEHSLITGNSSAAYYGFADPNLSPVIAVAFLNGDSTPYFEEVENQGSAADGMTYKVRIDCVAGKSDWRGAVKETGADA